MNSNSKKIDIFSSSLFLFFFSSITNIENKRKKYATQLPQFRKVEYSFRMKLFERMSHYSHHPKLIEQRKNSMNENEEKEKEKKYLSFCSEWKYPRGSIKRAAVLRLHSLILFSFSSSHAMVRMKWTERNRRDENWTLQMKKAKRH